MNQRAIDKENIQNFKDVLDEASERLRKSGYKVLSNKLLFHGGIIVGTAIRNTEPEIEVKLPQNPLFDGLQRAKEIKP